MNSNANITRIEPYFLETGEVWMGGETPIIGDPLYQSIIEEMEEPTGIPQGKYWITRIPTTLTILQEGSTGLKTPLKWSTLTRQLFLYF